MSVPYVKISVLEKKKGGQNDYTKWNTIQHNRARISQRRSKILIWIRRLH